MEAYHRRMPPFEIRPVTDDEYPAFVQAFIEGFASDVPHEDYTEHVKMNLPAERTLAAPAAAAGLLN